MDIRSLIQLDREAFDQIVTGYVAHERYAPTRNEIGDSIEFRLHLVRLDEPFIKRYDHLDAAAFQKYQEYLSHNLSLGIYDGDQLLGLAIAEPINWNSSLWVHEFHLAPEYRGKGLGLQLMDALCQRAREAGLAKIVCETQNTNVNAIRFYRRAGFTLDAIDLSFYEGEESAKGEIALFMKRNV